jgi:hypothetical protein
MKNIKSFDQYIKEELTHGYDTDTGGSSLLTKASDAAFGWLGRKFKNPIDTAYKFIEDEVERQVKSKEIKEDEIDLVISRTNGIITKDFIEGKSEKEIEKMILDYIKYMKDEILPTFNN